MAADLKQALAAGASVARDVLSENLGDSIMRNVT
jgi:hypothetical protein